MSKRSRAQRGHVLLQGKSEGAGDRGREIEVRKSESEGCANYAKNGTQIEAAANKKATSKPKLGEMVNELARLLF